MSRLELLKTLQAIINEAVVWREEDYRSYREIDIDRLDKAIERRIEKEEEKRGCEY